MILHSHHSYTGQTATVSKRKTMTIENAPMCAEVHADHVDWVTTGIQHAHADYLYSERVRLTKYGSETERAVKHKEPSEILVTIVTGLCPRE